jgi:hypothetical protein
LRLGLVLLLGTCNGKYELLPTLLRVALELPLCVMSLRKSILPIFMIVGNSMMSW